MEHVYREGGLLGERRSRDGLHKVIELDERVMQRIYGETDGEVVTVVLRRRCGHSLCVRPSHFVLDADERQCGSVVPAPLLFHSLYSV